MRKMLVLLFASSILIQAMGLTDTLSHLSDLAEHYEQHQKEYGDDFVAFVQKHFGEGKFDHYNEDHDHSKTHEELPFGHVHVDLTAECYYFDVLVPVKASMDFTVHSNFSYKKHYEFNYLHEYLDPPKTT